ncbi:MAG: NAD-dependent DNA ligase LigA [Defluviitaleaceae bacterium]|nr:NAD-dependent DNA ligase LigA [Defluviitaleaceae bacterium]
MNNLERMKVLVRDLNRANESYYSENKEIITNKEYDALYDELVSLETKTGIIMAKSPTINVGFEAVNSLKKQTHTTPMLSLDKTKSIDQLQEFLKKGDGLISYKLDGLTIVLRYEAGEFISAVTRGNGIIGEDVTHNVIHFKHVPKKISYKGSLLIRGEGIITYSDFEKINKSGEYKNPRNLCSGTVRQLDSSNIIKRPVHFLAFSILEGSDFEKKSEELEFLKNQGFEITPNKLVSFENIENVINKYKLEVTTSDFPTDGLVITYDDISFSKSLGATSKFPKDSIAFKWEDETKETKIKYIEWNTSRTGLINPTAVFETVELEGTNVSKASLHNLSIIEELKIGIGDIVTVYKANMIIPQIAENLTKTGPDPYPENCPECGSETIINQKVESKTLYCPNASCKAQIIKRLTHFVSRNAMNISGFSEATLSKFLERGFINNTTDIYKLERYFEEIKSLDGFGEKSIENILKNIETSRKVNLANLIYALGIDGIGLSTAKALCSHFSYDVQKIINAVSEDLMEIEGFGDILTNNFINYFTNEEELSMFLELLEQLEVEKPIVNENNTEFLAGLVFVITGNMEEYKNREELKEEIEKNGGKVSSSVSKNTSYLINNDTESNSSKNKKAKELGISIINEQGFIELLSLKGNKD